MEDKFKKMDVARYLLPPPGAEAVGECIKKIKDQSATIEEALDIINSYGGIDGDHHRLWVLDQVVRKLTGDKYDEWVKKHNDGEDGPNTYCWEEGIAP